MLKAHRRLSGSWNHNLEKQWGGPHHLSNLGPFGFLMVSLVKTVHVRLRTDFRWSHSLLLFSPSVVSDSATPWTEEPLVSLSFTISWSLLRLMAIESMMPTNHLILSPSSPALNLSQHQGLFQWVGSWHQVAKGLELQHQSLQWIFRVDFL